jgi:hypothetical protein
MTQNITIPLSDRTYRQIKRWAATRQQDVGDAIAEFLADNLPHNDALLIPPAAADAKVEQEKAAYLQLYPRLKMQYEGQYVAIHNGRLVDHDTNYGALFERIDDRYPDTFVWLTRVEDEPIRYLRQLRVRKGQTMWLSGTTGGRYEVDMYTLAVRIGQQPVQYLDVVGTENRDEVIVGRDLLNQYVVTLNAPGHTVGISL